VTPAERTLLLALFRWARTEGGMEWGRWAHRWSRQRGPREQWLGVDFDSEDGEYLSIYRGRVNARDYWVGSLVEAVDVLAALGIVPARFSSAYRAGWDVCVDIMRIPGAVIRTVTPPGDDGRGTSSGATRVGPR
jgi:hypothetical protein